MTGQPFLVPVALHVFAQYLTSQHVQRGKERRGSVALVVVGHRWAAAFLQRQARLGAVQRLNLRLLIHAQHDGMGGRANVKANHIVQFLRKGGIVRKLELTPAMRAQAVRLPHRPTIADDDRSPEQARCGPVAIVG